MMQMSTIRYKKQHDSDSETEATAKHPYPHELLFSPYPTLIAGSHTLNTAFSVITVYALVVVLLLKSSKADDDDNDDPPPSAPCGAPIVPRSPDPSISCALREPFSTPSKRLLTAAIPKYKNITRVSMPMPRPMATAMRERAPAARFCKV